MSDLTASAWMDDWYVVEHSGGVPEGSESDWRAIIALMRKQECGAPARRVGVNFRKNGGAELYSPRNAHDDRDCVHIPAVDVLYWIERAEALLNSIPRAKIDAAVEVLQKLTEEQRREVVSNFCRHCMCDKLPCHCMCDE